MTATPSPLRTLLLEATPGEWSHYHDKLRPQYATVIDEIQGARGQRIVAWPGFDAADGTAKRKAANAALIVATVNALPALLDERDALRGALERLEVDTRALVASASRSTKNDNAAFVDWRDLQALTDPLARARAALKETPR